MNPDQVHEFFLWINFFSSIPNNIIKRKWIGILT